VEHDVLDRYYQAARYLKADIVVRVTSDCPLIDPSVCDAVIQLRQDADADYACNNMPPTWPHGLDCEAFTAEVLARASREARDPYEREHVTPWIRTKPGLRRANLPGPEGDSAGQRWTLDFPEDLAFFRALVSRLSDGEGSQGYAEIRAILDRHPEIQAINAGRRDSGRVKQQAAEG
jgi:spore coat polysaccharide biosynthesis protein SpsF (cytidylyltransferase family)